MTGISALRSIPQMKCANFGPSARLHLATMKNELLAECRLSSPRERQAQSHV
jgi:hypothetical protein